MLKDITKLKRKGTQQIVWPDLLDKLDEVIDRLNIISRVLNILSARDPGREN